jgi:hypothetical protein
MLSNATITLVKQDGDWRIPVEISAEILQAAVISPYRLACLLRRNGLVRFADLLEGWPNPGRAGPRHLTTAQLGLLVALDYRMAQGDELPDLVASLRRWS